MACTEFKIWRQEGPEGEGSWLDCATDVTEPTNYVVIGNGTVITGVDPNTFEGNFGTPIMLETDENGSIGTAQNGVAMRGKNTHIATISGIE